MIISGACAFLWKSSTKLYLKQCRCLKALGKTLERINIKSQVSGFQAFSAQFRARAKAKKSKKAKTKKVPQKAKCQKPKAES